VAQGKDPPFVIGKITIFYGKTMGKPWENGDLYGKIMKDPPFYSWVNPLFRLGHGFNSYTVITRG
jgi:hypothetical protein